MNSESHIPTLKRGGNSSKPGVFVARQKKELFEWKDDSRERLIHDDIESDPNQSYSDYSNESLNSSVHGRQSNDRYYVEYERGSDRNLREDDSSAEDIDDSDDDTEEGRSFHEDLQAAISDSRNVHSNHGYREPRQEVDRQGNDVENEYEYVIVNSRVRLKEAELRRNLALSGTSGEREKSSLRRGASASASVLIRANREMSAGKSTTSRPQSSERGVKGNGATKTSQLPSRSSPRSASNSSRQSPRTASGLRSNKPLRQSPRLSPNPSPRNGRATQKGIKEGDNSLKLSLKGLNDSDDEDDTVYDGEETASPRKERSASPRKGVMSTTKSFEAKTSSMRRNESDGSLIRQYVRTPPGPEHGQSTNKKPVLMKSLSNKDFSIHLTRKASSNDDLNRSGSFTDIKGEPVLKRTSSGRKLPGLPIEKVNKVVQKSNTSPNMENGPSKPVDTQVKHSESDSSFLSIKKDGSTEYVALDFNDMSGSSNMKTSTKESVYSPNNSIVSNDSDKSTEIKPKSPLEKRPPIAEHPQPRGNPSPRDIKTGGKPPLERKPSKGIIEKTVPASPRNNVPASPRKSIIAASPRGIPSPRTQGSPRGPKSSSPRRVQSASPRTMMRASQSSPRENGRGSSIERQPNVDKVKHPESIHNAKEGNNVQKTGSESISNGPSVDVPSNSPTRKVRRHSGGSIVSPRSSSPVKRVRQNSGSELQFSKIVEEPSPRSVVYSRQDSCSSLELQQIIDVFRVGQDSIKEEARSETEVQSEKTWMDSERVWLVHKGGFASASQHKGEGQGVPEGRVRIRLDHGGEILEVDEDDVEKANPPQLDRAEDLSLLRYLNESSALHTLRQRYGSSLIHTYAGPSLILVNPMQSLQIYSDKVIQMFKGCKQEDMPPHIFASAQIAYREMLNTRQDQSIVVIGRSGSGKTYNMRHLLHYLVVSAGTVNNTVTVDKLNAMTSLLEAFGNSRTILNTSASRFSQLTTFDYDHSGQIVSASVQVLMFEKTRVVRRPEGEPTFHVFYQLLAGVDSKLRSELQLDSLNEPNLFMTPLQKTEDKQRAMQYWAKIHNAMEVIHVTEDEIKSICSVLAAIYHLGVAGAVKGNNNKGQFARPAGAQRAATLLGISVEELGRNIFSSSGTATLTRNTSRSTSSPADKNAEAHTTAMEALEGFAIGLYSDVFNAIVSLINRSMSSTYRSATSITVVDTPGFQNPATCGRQSGASFEDLCHNYTQEKLQLLFHDLVFTTPQDRYSQENVDCDFEFVTSSPAAMVSLIEKAPAQTLLTRPYVLNFLGNKDQQQHTNDDVFTSTNDNHLKVNKGQGHDTERSPKGLDTERSPRSSSSSSLSGSGFMSRIPIKVTPATLKSYGHLCNPVSRRTSSGASDDLDEVRTSTAETRESEKKGLLWILDEEAIFPGATEDSFMDRFFSYHGEQKVKRDSLLRKASSLGNTFILNHFQGTNPVQYNASGWLKVCRENPITKVATQVLQDSKKQNIKELFNSVKAPVGGMVSGSIVGMEGSNTLRRVGSMRRTFMSGTAGLKKRSMCLQVKFQVDSIIETLRKTKCHFIHCLLPQANAGLCEVRTAAEIAADKPDDILMNIPLIRSQFRGNEILDSVRIHRQGFPDYLTFPEFIQKFEGLIPPNVRPTKELGEKASVIQIVEHLDIDKLNYRIGLSRVFFRAGCLNRLESSRDDKVTGRIINFQAYCRGYLARKNLEKRRVQNVAIRCIQKNVKKFYQIRDWDWWKLYLKVKPLLNVHRTEEELRDKELELEQMKTKLERLERERNDLKQQADKMENRVVELTADLAEENTTSTQASEMLETESAERMRLEKELKDVSGKYQALKRNHEKLEMESMQLKLWQAESLDGELDEDEVDGGIYKERYEKSRRELQYTRKQLQQQHEEEMDQERAARKQVEKRLHEALEDVEDAKRQLSSAKKKHQKVLSEMHDSKLLLEEQMSRNNDLERKQRKFDTELNNARKEETSEKTQREKLQRERDTLLAEKYSLEKEVNRLKGDVESQDAKYERLQKELGETLTSSGMKDDNEISNLKKAKNELETKVLDQEEELDDQAGQIQQLEQSKVRLEMNLEKSRQQHLKDIEEKEQEMEELRYSTQKKLKQMEAQVEEENEERRIQVQKNRELDAQLQELKNQASFRDKDSEKRLKKSLRRTKALLKDAELVLQKQKTGEGSKNAVKQLKNQLEDAEFTAAASVKAKKTMEIELADLQQQIDDLFKSKQDAENKYMSLIREKSDVQNQLEENEEDMSDIMKKYKAVVQQQSVDQITMNDQLQQIEELVQERDKAKSEANDLRLRIQTFEENSVDKTVVLRLENRVRELETKLDYELANKHRLEVQVGRTKEQAERTTEEKEQMLNAKSSVEETHKRTQKQLRDLREEFSDVQKKEMELSQKSKENESKVNELEADFDQTQSDLKLAFKRIADLQAALEDGLDSEDEFSDSDSLGNDDSDNDSFLSNHIRSPLRLRTKSYDSGTRSSSRGGSVSSSITDLPSSPRISNNIDISEA